MRFPLAAYICAGCILSGWLLVCCADPGKEVYDHQTVPYHVKHRPVEIDSPITITPFFSPEHSTDTIVALIQSARTSIDIGTPGFSSWSGCTPFVEAKDTCMKACTPEQQRGEAFPVFAALLNAVHGGVKVPTAAPWLRAAFSVAIARVPHALLLLFSFRDPQSTPGWVSTTLRTRVQASASSCDRSVY
jgi:hypothetical protein